MNTIIMAIAKLYWSEPIFGSSMSYLLRAAIASQFPDEPIFHQHTDSGVIYRYPLIHYRWTKECGILIAFGRGAESLIKIPFLENSLRIGDKDVRIAEVRMDLSRHQVQVTRTLMRYYFRSPWLPFNQDNFQRYKNMNRLEQQTECDRLAVANILSALKGLDVHISEHIYAGFIPKRSCACRYKDINLTGFLGTLLTNITLPSGVAVGKAVSHGYGWLERIGSSPIN